MYVILVKDDDSLLVTQKERIMQRSKLFNDLWFIADPVYKGYNMADCTVLLEYTSPVSRKYRTEILTLSEDMYEGYLKYLLPIDTCITAEAGFVELQLTFICSDLDISGNSIQRVRKTVCTEIEVTPIAAWSDIIPDSALTALDQRIIKMDAQIKALNSMSENIYQSKADNVSYNRDTNEFQLTADGSPIGDKIVLKTGETDPDGTIVVDFSNYAGDYDNEEEDDSNASDVVEF